MSTPIARDWQSASLAPTYRAMAILPPMVGPRAALKDLAAFMRQRSRDQLIGAALAVLVTLIIVIIFFVDSKINTAPPPYIVYVDQWSANRTDAEIIAQQKKDQAEVEAFRKERQEQFQKLENQLGM